MRYPKKASISNVCARGEINRQTQASIQAFLQAIENYRSPFKAKCCVQDKDSTIKEEITYNIQQHCTFACKNTNILTTRYQYSITFTLLKHLHLQHSHLLVNSKIGY